MIKKTKYSMKKDTLTVYAEKEYKIGKLKLLEFGDELVYQNTKNIGKTIPNSDGYICHLKTVILDWIFFDTKKSTAHIHLKVDLNKLETFVKKARKAQASFKKDAVKRRKEKKRRLPRIFFRHLNPEVSFLFRY